MPPEFTPVFNLSDILKINDRVKYVVSIVKIDEHRGNLRLELDEGKLLLRVMNKWSVLNT